MEILRPEGYHRKKAFFETTKNWKSAGGGRNRPEGLWIVLGHHNRNIWHISITKSCFFHRFKKKNRRPKDGWLFLDSTVIKEMPAFSQKFAGIWKLQCGQKKWHGSSCKYFLSIFVQMKKNQLKIGKDHKFFRQIDNVDGRFLEANGWIQDPTLTWFPYK